MITLHICGIGEATSLLSQEWPDKTISLIDPDLRNAKWQSPSDSHHIEFFHDIDVPDPKERWLAPTYEHVANVLDFAECINPGEKVLIHCHAGISRSTAIAIAVLCKKGLTPEMAMICVEKVRNQLWPNSLIIEHADEYLGLNGALSKTVGAWKKTKLSDFQAGGSKINQKRN